MNPFTNTDSSKGFLSRGKDVPLKLSNRVYISNIPKEYTREHIKTLFEQEVGQVLLVNLYLKTNVSKGRIDFANEVAAKRAIKKMHQYQLGGRKINVIDPWDPGYDAPDSGPSRRQEYQGENVNKFAGSDLFHQERQDNWKDGNTYGLRFQLIESLGIKGPLIAKVYFHNIPNNLRVEHIKDIFGIAGRIVNVFLFEDSDRRNEGRGTVVYEHPLEAVQAILMLHHQTVMKRKLSVKMFGMSYPIQELEQSRLPAGLQGVGMGLCLRDTPLVNLSQLSAMDTEGNRKTEDNRRKGNLTIHDELKKKDNLIRLNNVVFICKDGEKEVKISVEKSLYSGSAEFQLLLCLPENASNESMNTNLKQDGMNSKEEQIICLSEVNPEELRIILKFLFSGDLGIQDVSHAINVFVLARRFKMTRVYNQCLKTLDTLLDNSNVINVFEYATTNKLVELEQVTMKFIQKNGHSVIDTPEFLRLTNKNLRKILVSDHLEVEELFLFQRALCWAKEECRRMELTVNSENLRLALRSCLYQIRFPVMDPIDFAKYVVPTKILEEDSVHDLQYYFSVNWYRGSPDNCQRKERKPEGETCKTDNSESDGSEYDDYEDVDIILVFPTRKRGQYSRERPSHSDISFSHQESEDPHLKISDPLTHNQKEFFGDEEQTQSRDVVRTSSSQNISSENIAPPESSTTLSIQAKTSGKSSAEKTATKIQELTHPTSSSSLLDRPWATLKSRISEAGVSIADAQSSTQTIDKATNTDGPAMSWTTPNNPSNSNATSQILDPPTNTNKICQQLGSMTISLPPFIDVPRQSFTNMVTEISKNVETQAIEGIVESHITFTKAVTETLQNVETQTIEVDVEHNSKNASRSTHNLDGERVQQEIKRLESNFQNYGKQIAELKQNNDAVKTACRTTLEKAMQMCVEVEDMVENFELGKRNAIRATKMKQWCANCGQEASFTCCWNMSYCGYPCKVQHSHVCRIPEGFPETSFLQFLPS